MSGADTGAPEPTQTPFTIGVEEEFFLVDRESRALRPRAERVLAVAKERLGEQVSFELHLAQVETGTVICSTLQELRDDIFRLRRGLMEAAAQEDSCILPAGTHPFSDWIGQQTTPSPRYEELDEAYQQLVWEQLVCGCHVHVCVPDPDLAIAIMDHTRPWLSILRALTTNSPFWNGVDTGYASYRMELFDRWPTTGAPPALGTRKDYDELVELLVATEVVSDASKIYWDIRPSMRYSTVEYRVADVVPSIDEVVMLAGLSRALTRVGAAAVEAGVAVPDVSGEVLRAARWRAARYGLSERLVDVAGGRAVPAGQLVEDLLAHLRDDLEAYGEWEEISSITRRVASEGNGTTRQRRIFAERGNHRDVVDGLIAAALPDES